MKATIYHVDGRIEEREVGSPSLNELQTLVGGYIRVVPRHLLGPKGLTFALVLVDEDGYPRRREPNLTATQELGFREPGPFLGVVVALPEKPKGW